MTIPLDRLRQIVNVADRMTNDRFGCSHSFVFEVQGTRVNVARASVGGYAITLERIEREGVGYE